MKCLLPALLTGALLFPCRAALAQDIKTSELSVDSLQTEQALEAQDEAQEISPLLPQITPPSPDVSSLMKFSEIPVNYYTGIPNIEIPLHTVNEADIDVPITLAYHASGIRVNEEASWVGLGWALQAGGVISRTIVGQDDLEDTYLEDSSLPDITATPSSTNTTSPYVYWGCDQVVNGINLCDYLGRFSTQQDSNIPIPYDFEPDQFNFSFPGNSGKFIIRRNGEIVLQKQQKISIVYQRGGNQWVIKDDQGFTYRYQDRETTSIPGEAKEETTAWYLNEIVSPKGNRIAFSYTKDAEQDRYTIGDITETRSVSYCAVDQSSITNPEQRTYKGLTLDTINFTNGQVKFVYSTDRLDQEGGKKLNKIEIYEKTSSGAVASQPLKYYDFTYGYFEGNSENVSRYPAISDNRHITDRLKLVSVREGAVSSSKPSYSFTYYESNLAPNSPGLPSKASFAQDYWGYYNGENGSAHIAPTLNTVVAFPENNSRLINFPGQDRSVVPSFSRAFALKEIFYPTGGNTLFEYESNDYDLTKSRPISNSTTPNPIPNQLLPKDQNINGTRGEIIIVPLDLTEAYVNPDDNKVYISSTFSFRCTEKEGGCQAVAASNEEAYFRLYTDSNANNPVSSGFARVDLTDATFCYNTDPICDRGPFQLKLDPAIYYVKVTWDESVDLTGMNATYSWMYEDEDEVKETEEDGLAGGLRIAKITYKPVVGSAIVKKYTYNYSEDRDNNGIAETYSYGRLMDFPRFERYEYNEDYSVPPGQNVICPSFIQSSTSNVILGIHGYTVGYDQVTEVMEAGDNGKSVYEYYNRVQTVNYGEEFWYPGIPNATAGSNGLLKKQTEYRSSSSGYKKVREIENTYDFDSLNFDTPPSVSGNSTLIYGIKKRLVGFIPSPSCSNNSGTSGICFPSSNSVDLFFYPAIHSEWITQESSTERIYHQDNEAQFVAITTNYEYENTPNHYQLRKRATTDSKSQTRTTNYKYATDFEGSTTYGSNLLRDNHMHSQVLEQTTTVDEGSNAVTTQKVTTTYSSPSGNIVPTLVNNYLTGTDEAVSTNYEYDNQGNVRQVRGPDGVPTAFIWGYNQTLPVAKVVGATYAEAAAKINMTALQSLDEDALRSELNKLRSLSKAQITTYTHDPLVGITSETDPNGRMMIYHYDDLNRLRWIESQEGHVVQKFDYQYAQP